MRWIILPGLLALAGCMAEEEKSAQAQCPAASLQSYVGQPESALDPGMISGPVRVVGPNSMVTLDHRPDRTNIALDEDGIITGITCG